MLLKQSGCRLDYIAMAICHHNGASAMACSCAWKEVLLQCVLWMTGVRVEKSRWTVFYTDEKWKFLSLSALLLHLFPGRMKFGANNKYANYNLSHSFKIFKWMLNTLVQSGNLLRHISPGSCQKECLFLMLERYTRFTLLNDHSVKAPIGVLLSLWLYFNIERQMVIFGASIQLP